MTRLLKYKTYFILILCIMLILGLFIFKSDAYASELEGEPYIIISSYEVSDGKITPGSTFKLKLVIDNKDELFSAKNVLVNVQTNDYITLNYPSVSQVYVGDMAPGAENELTFDFSASKYINVENALFYVTIASDTRQNYVTISAPIESGGMPFEILTVTVPETATNEDGINAFLNFKSLRDYNLSNVALNLYIDDELFTTSTVGIISAGATKSQNLSFVLETVGSHDVKLELQATDSHGEVQSYEVYKGKIDITESSAGDDVDITGYDSQRILSRNERAIVIISSIMVIVCTFGIIFIVRKYN